MQINDYLHLYIGCECVWIKDQYPNRKGDRFTLGYGELSYWNDKKKPILRPLYDITSDEVAMLFDLDVDAKVIKGNYYNPFFQIEYIDDKGEVSFAHQYLSQLSPLQFVYLLSKHFDLFGLIEAGLAIDKKA